MQIEEVKISDIENHPKNPKQHPEKQIRLIEKSMKRFGWTNPVILSADGVILAGHARVKAAIEQGHDTVPCIRTKLSGEEADAYLLADNRLSDIAPYDRDILAELLADIPSDLAEITGFDQVQVDALLAGEDIPDIDRFISDSQPEEEREEVDAEPQIDRAAELNKTWKVKPGDLWQLGDHRLICGDCTDPVVVERVMMGEKADLVFTDPPYGVGMCIENDDLKGEEFDSFNARWVSEILSDDNCGFVCYHSTRTFPSVLISAIKCGYKFERMLWYYVPDKFPAHSWNHWMMVSQAIMLFSKGDVVYANTESDQDCYKMTSADLGTSNGHPTEKRQDNCKRVMSHYFASVVYDPFLGSGTTLIACENTGRKCRGIEISPDYCAVILQRFKDATGKEPVRING